MAATHKLPLCLPCSTSDSEGSCSDCHITLRNKLAAILIDRSYRAHLTRLALKIPRCDERKDKRSRCPEEPAHHATLNLLKDLGTLRPEVAPIMHGRVQTYRALINLVFDEMRKPDSIENVTAFEVIVTQNNPWLGFEYGPECACVANAYAQLQIENDLIELCESCLDKRQMHVERVHRNQGAFKELWETHHGDPYPEPGDFEVEGFDVFFEHFTRKERPEESAENRRKFQEEVFLEYFPTIMNMSGSLIPTIEYSWVHKESGNVDLGRLAKDLQTYQLKEFEANQEAVEKGESIPDWRPRIEAPEIVPDKTGSAEGRDSKKRAKGKAAVDPRRELYTRSFGSIDTILEDSETEETEYPSASPYGSMLDASEVRYVRPDVQQRVTILPSNAPQALAGPRSPPTFRVIRPPSMDMAARIAENSPSYMPDRQPDSDTESTRPGMTPSRTPNQALDLAPDMANLNVAASSSGAGSGTERPASHQQGPRSTSRRSPSSSRPSDDYAREA